MNFQLINSISNDLQKLIGGTAILTFLNTPLSASVNVLRKLDLYLKDVELPIVISAGFLALFI